MPLLLILAFGSSDVKESSCNTEDPDLILVGNIPWRRKWQPTPIFFPGDSHRQRRLQSSGYRLQSMGSQRVRHDRVTHTHTLLIHPWKSEFSSEHIELTIFLHQVELCFPHFNFMLELHTFRLRGKVFESLDCRLYGKEEWTDWLV